MSDAILPGILDKSTGRGEQSKKKPEAFQEIINDGMFVKDTTGEALRCCMGLSSRNVIVTFARIVLESICEFRNRLS